MASRLYRWSRRRPVEHSYEYEASTAVINPKINRLIRTSRMIHPRDYNRGAGRDTCVDVLDNYDRDVPLVPNGYVLKQS